MVYNGLMKKNWITVKSFETPGEAHVLQSLLQHHDIDSFIQDEMTVSMDWLYSQALGGVRLQVRSEDLERACALIDRQPKTDLKTCAECGEALKRPSAGKVAANFISWLLIHVPLFMSPRRRRYCAECRA